ncbi:hypothetical protein BH11ACT8_BH11ACT8_31820 [soil metagenome]
MEIDLPTAHVTLHELSEDECWALLEQHSTGRIGYVRGADPMVVPLNYLARDREIWWRTSWSTEVAKHLDDAVVAFEVDAVDPLTHQGWSVLVHGRAEQVATGHHGEHLGQVPAPWPDDVRRMEFRMVPHAVSGRRLTATPA